MTGLAVPTMTPEEEAAWVADRLAGVPIVLDFRPASFPGTMPRGRPRSDDPRSEETATSRAREILLERYPCMELPRGALSGVARELGVTRELVRQAANAIGMESSYVGLREARTAREARKGLCPNCGQPRGGRQGLCADCRWIMVACDGCETLFKRNRDALRIKQNNPNDHGHNFCSSECWKAYQLEVVRRPRPTAYILCVCGHYRSWHAYRCKECGCPAYTMGTIKQSPRGGERNVERNTEIRRLRSLGMGSAAIAREMGLTYAVVSQVPK